jgi:DNA-binding MarR family transcriptional regulator
MTDINSGALLSVIRDPDPDGNEALLQAIEFLYFAYRGFTAEADSVLAALGLGRAHHRVIYFVGRNPGITVSELLSILHITKQSLARVLTQLLNAGFIAQSPGAQDKRQRRLALTRAGIGLEKRLTEAQRRLIADACAKAGGDALPRFLGVLEGMIDPSDRARLDRRRAACDSAP